MRKLFFITSFLAICICAYQLWGTDAGIVRHYILNSSGSDNITTGKLGTTPTMMLDFDQDPSGATITAEGSGAFALTKVSDPARINDFTGYAHKFDGDDAYTCADGTCATNPAGSFSVIAVVTPNSVTGTQYLMDKWIASDPNRSWTLYLTTTSVAFAVSKDGSGGASQSTATRTTCAAIGRTSIIIGVYTYVGDGTSQLDLYCDNLAVATTASAVGPAYDNNEDFVIGASGTPASFFTGNMHHAEYINGKAMSATEVTAWMKNYRGMVSNTGNSLSTTCATCPGLTYAPPDSGIEPFIIRNGANTSWVGSPVDDQGGIYNCPAVSNLVKRSAICETPDVSVHPTGWTVVETASNVVCDTTTYANGSASVKIEHDDINDVSTITSQCNTVGQGADLYSEFYAKKASGTAQLTLNILEYDAADCSGGVLATDVIVNATDLTTSWAYYGGLLATATWNGATSSWQYQWSETGDAVVEYLDLPLAWASSTSALTSFCSCTADTDATAACNAEYVSMTDNPIQPGGTYEVELSFYSNWIGNDSVVHYFFSTGGTTTNDILIDKSAANSFACRFYDTAGSGKTALETVDGTDWPAATKHSLKCTRTSEGNVYGSINRVASATPTTDRSAIQNATDTTVTFGTAAQSHRGVLSNIIIRRRSTQP